MRCERGNYIAMSRIKNIIFDMGNVITVFAPERFVSFYSDDPEERAALVQTVFKSLEYRQLDLGTSSYREATEIWQKRQPRLAEAIGNLAEHWYEHKEVIVPVNKLAVLLKSKGFRLYLLSNASDKFKLYKDNIPALRILDGAVLSCEHHILKPDPRLYSVLFETYSLKPENCFFIDDLPKNIEAGRALGMEGFVFPQDVCHEEAVRQLLSELSSHGITIDYNEVEDVKL